MRRSIRRASAAVAAGAALGAAGISGVSAAGAATHARHLAMRPEAVRALATPGARLWMARYNGPGNSDDVAFSVAASPDGTKVYVTGYSYGASSGQDYATVGYNAATGARLWAARYNGPASANGFDVAHAVAVSPDGSKVYVTGASAGATSQGDYATIAYNAATGARLWIRRYNSPDNGYDAANSLAVNPNGNVYVTGQSSAPSIYDYVTIAYSPAGARLWVARYNHKADDRGFAVGVSPDGTRVYVTGFSSTLSGWDYATVGYNAATGAQLWVRRYSAGTSEASSPSLAVSAAGKVIVAATTSGHYATIAHSPTGTQLWAAPLTVAGVAASVAAPGTGKVYVTGTSGTVARNIFTGKQLWIQPHNGVLKSVAVANGKVYVTGITSGDYATTAYDAVTGARLWAARYNGPGNGGDEALSVAVRAERVFVTGGSAGTTSGSDYATIAYTG